MAHSCRRPAAVKGQREEVGTGVSGSAEEGSTHTVELWRLAAAQPLLPCVMPSQVGHSEPLQALSLGCMGSAHLPSIPLLPGPRYGKLIFWDMSPE